MSFVNIPRNVKDAFYRYRMPILIAKIEGKGNGIKTVISNMPEIGKSLNRPPSYPTKYFGCELGAQVICDEKSNRYIVNGAHDAHRLQDLLDGFISKFVLCPACQNPETDLVISRDATIYTTCKACGQRKPINQRHKLVTFILKNAPLLKKRKDKEGSRDMVNGKTSSGDEELAIKITNETLEHSKQAYENDGDWTDDMDAKAVVGDEEEDDNVDDPLEDFAHYLKERPSVDQIFGKIDELGIRHDKAVAVYIQVSFGNNVLESLSAKLDFLKKICTDEKTQKGLLGGLERLVTISHKEEQKRLPLILQALYQDDILEEEVLLHWACRPSKKYVDKETAKSLRISAAPFIDWLKSADESSSSEEGS